jgi:hypothetical protein
MGEHPSKGPGEDQGRDPGKEPGKERGKEHAKSPGGAPGGDAVPSRSADPGQGSYGGFSNQGDVTQGHGHQPGTGPGAGTAGPTDSVGGDAPVPDPSKVGREDVGPGRDGERPATKR